jgi:hypothetical protein
MNAHGNIKNLNTPVGNSAGKKVQKNLPQSETISNRLRIIKNKAQATK